MWRPARPRFLLDQLNNGRGMPRPYRIYNRRVLHRLTAAALSVAIPVAALCALLVHAHLDDHHADHDDAPVVHSHFSGHVDAAPPVHPGEARLGTHDDELAIS